MKLNKMPITMVLLTISWLIAAIGFVFAWYCIVFKLWGNKSIIFGLLILIGSLLLASVTRMLANIGQLIFEINKSYTSYIQLLNQNLTLQVQGLNQHLSLQCNEILNELKRVQNLS